MLENIYASKLEHLDEMDGLLVKYNLLFEGK